MAVYVLTIHGWIPARLNQLIGNRRKAARLKRRDRQIVAVYAKLQGIPEDDPEGDGFEEEFADDADGQEDS